MNQHEEQTICPVMNAPVNKDIAEKKDLVREYKGQKYYFCCSDCPPEFDKNPEKYLKDESLK